jgi:hypothetical protein
MTLPSFLILVAMGFVGLTIFLWLGGLPGKTAAQRSHPQAEAINILGWVGLAFGGVGWVVALTWAHIKPIVTPVEAAPASSATPAPEAPAEEDS